MASVGSVALVSPTLADGLIAPDRAADKTETKPHQHRPLSGPLASATVSFGQWSAAPLDRFPNLNAPVVPNQHQLTPNEVTIKAGGAVNFIIAGFHIVLVYGDGTQAADININATVPPTVPLTPAGPPLINDPNNRIYRGLDPSLQPQDRVEIVSFPNPGTFLVICGVRPHFVNDGMFGFVRVIP
ncbi:MAG: hypothetical protein ACRD5G_16570 [Candidatus Acidiferrales bacterium]